jgi:nucleoid-associated protein YgaU
LKLNESTISMALGAVVIIIVGILVINYFKKPGKGEIVPASTTETQQETAQRGKTHIVKKGETLWSIAEDAYGSGYNWVDISNTNKITNPGIINEGQELTIPDVEPKVTTVADKLASDSSFSNKISGATYTVVRGDSLWKIAVRAYGDGYKWVEIAKANKLVNPNLIHPGNILTLPR